MNSADALEHFRKEARAISRLKHENIETIYELGEVEKQQFMVLEYLSGGTLASKIQDMKDMGQKLSLRLVVDCALQISEGLAYAHRRGVVHRDIKPSNVLCTEEQKVKITDFGLAKFIHGGDSSSKRRIAGTIPYMSPEQVNGVEVDHRTDIYSFGVLLYEITTGENLFKGLTTLQCSNPLSMMPSRRFAASGQRPRQSWMNWSAA